MEAIAIALIERVDVTHLALLAVIGAQWWQIRDQSRQASTWAAAMDRLAETLTALRVEIAVRLR